MDGGRDGYLQGAKEGVDELAFFPDSSANGRNLLMNSYKDYSQQSQEDQQQHCFVWGTDFKSVKTEKETAAAVESQKPLLHFFGEWQQPTKNTGDTWLDLASNSGGPNDG